MKYVIVALIAFVSTNAFADRFCGPVNVRGVDFVDYAQVLDVNEDGMPGLQPYWVSATSDPNGVGVYMEKNYSWSKKNQNSCYCIDGDVFSTPHEYYIEGQEEPVVEMYTVFTDIRSILTCNTFNKIWPK